MTDNEKTVYSYYKQKGLSDNAVAGIMGNIKTESNFNSTATNKSSGAYGIFQWLGGRKTRLQEYAKAHNKSASDLTTQLDYSWVEMNSTEKKTLSGLMDNSTHKTASDFAVMFDKVFERSEGTSVSARTAYATQYSLDSSVMGKINSGNQAMSETWANSTGEITGGETDLFSSIFKVVVIGILIIGGVVFFALAIGSFSTLTSAVDTIKSKAVSE